MATGPRPKDSTAAEPLLAPAWVNPDLDRLMVVHKEVVISTTDENSSDSDSSTSISTSSKSYYKSWAESLVDLPAGAIFARINGVTPTSKRDYDTVQSGTSSHFIWNSDLYYCNHSCSPTLECDTSTWEVRVSRDRPLRKGDVLSVFYPSTEWIMAPGEGGSRGPNVTTDRSHDMEPSISNGTGRHPRSHSLSMGNTVDRTDVGASPADVDLLPFIDWGAFSENHQLGMAADDGSSIDMLSDFGQFNTDDALWTNMDNLDMPSPFETSTPGLPMASTFTTTTLLTPPASASGHATRPKYPYSSFEAVSTRVSSNVMSQLRQPQSRGPGDASTSAGRPGIGVFVKVLSNLETELGILPLSIDRTMHVVNTSTKSVHRVLQYPSTQLGIAGPMLALVSIDMILILIESIISRWRECRSTELGQHNFQDSGSFPGIPRPSDSGHGQRDQLLLGHYRVEGEETDVIWRNIVITELRRVRKLVQGLNGHLDDPRHSVKLPVERLRTSYTHLDHRAARLMTTLQRYDQNAGTSMASTF
ncbi:uncharacterized protein FIESC28_09533 [Fusarium coffeatum]|uniref:SET domain-containing protein n=1 Tax=Fusarium coffeatum TaxID=231269 RepID=A0A366QZF6_9HYPO|nr:uncharacterized protein FIESC28_09533 [Fusarium coffeatum]RBR10283.1 hypothetical protein FIESC28_09533 [Fusarium coffeatum]